MSGAFDFVGGHVLEAITPDEVAIGVPFTERRRVLPARTVVVVTYNHPNRDLVDYLDPAAYGIHLVGDVTGTNSLMAAIHQAAGVTRTM
jgi:hypothetical protein